MSRTERREKDSELSAGDDRNICRYCQRGLDQRTPFICGALVMWRNEMEKVTLSLISDHLDEVGEELAFWFELDHVFPSGDSYGNSGRPTV